MTSRKRTAFGTVLFDDDGTCSITAGHSELRAWANRPGAKWPGSDLAVLESITATFTANGDLVDLDQSPGPAELDEFGVDFSCDEFNAWSSDVLAEASR